jgi:membrane protease YdiL (CAAX protease family)
MEPPAAGVPDAARLLRVAAVFYALLFGLALLWARLEGQPLAFAPSGPPPRALAWLRDLALGLAAGGALVLASRALTAATALGRALADALAELLGRPGPWVCVALAIVSGVAEEAFFRGALQPRVGLVAASGLFALAHFAPRRAFLPWPVFAFAAGLCFGALLERTGSLLAPIVAHACVNALNLRWLATRPDA